MTTVKLDFHVQALVSYQFFEDWLVTALEGGSNYWINRIGVESDLPKVPRDKGAPLSVWVAKNLWAGGQITFVAGGDGVEDSRHALTRDLLLAGVQRLHAVQPKRFAASIVGLKARVIGEESELEFVGDAEDADSMLQLALFNEVRYG